MSARRRRVSARPEPLLNTAAATALGSALIALLVSFGLPLTGDQQSAIVAVVAVAGPLAVAALARRQVTPVADPQSADGTPLVEEP